MSCLFVSLGHFVNINDHDLRTKICDFLATNPAIIDDMKCSEIIQFQSDIPATDLETYICKMRNQCVMGGAIEISAFTKMFNINVKVKSSRLCDNGSVIEFVSANENKWITLRWTGNHYDPAN